jgi:Transcriptional regulator PadR-like family
VLESLELSILAAIRRLTRNGEFTGGLAVGKDLGAVGIGVEDKRLYGLLMNLKDDGYIKATLVMSTSSNAFKMLQLTSRGREAARTEVDPFDQVITEARSALGSDGFARAFPGAFQPWADAENLLWGSDASTQLTTIGHKVREASQAFATAMIDRYGSEGGHGHGVSQVEKRLGSVIAKHRMTLGDDRRKVLEGLGALWSASNKLVQRQEHGAQKEGEDVTWDDARRIVYLTVFLMIEFVSMFEQLPGPPVAVLEPQ